MPADLKSLAHPDWPYAGTAHEWRGFVKTSPFDPKASFEAVHRSEGDFYEKLCNEPAGSFVGVHNGTPVFQGEGSSIYQKQNLGPDLD